jgi:5-enolpyruvylshikimate-3-phosphate synthase
MQFASERHDVRSSPHAALMMVMVQASEIRVATGTSSQFLSGLLMAAAVAEGEGSVMVKSASDSVVSEP